MSKFTMPIMTLGSSLGVVQAANVQCGARALLLCGGTTGSRGLWASVCGMIVAQAMSTNVARLGPAREAQTVQSGVYPGPVQVL